MNAANRLRRLLGAKHGLERSIREESLRPRPDSLRLSALKSAKLRINDQVRRLGSVLGEARAARAEVRGVKRRRMPLATG